MGLNKWLQKGIKVGVMFVIIMLLVFQQENLQAVQGQVAYRMTSSQLQEKFYKTRINEKINVAIWGATVEDALRQVANQTGLKLTYRGDIVEKKTITIIDKEIEVTDVLNLILEGTNLDYMFSEDGYLLVYQSDEELRDIIFQQEVSGTVVDAETGEPLPGVNIIVKDTNIGTSTDLNGEFVLDVETLQDTLVISFVGYQIKEEPINGRNEINILLERQVVAGEELIVIGYGTQERQQITGSVSRVSEEQFVKGAVNNANNLLQGKVPGLTISTVGGNPNADPEIRLRGISSFGPNQEPLVVVDGIIGANLDNIDPSDISSMDVLKDASASAIYGTRGSGGVILVTTKKGSSENINVSYNSHITADFIENQLNPLSPSEFRAEAEKRGITILDDGVNTNWFDEISQTGLQNVHNLSISGGNQSTTYRVSGNFRDIDGIQKETGFQRVNGRLNLTHETLDDNLTLTVNLSGTQREEEIGFPGAFRYATTFPPTLAVKKEEFKNTGGYREIPGGIDVYNPVNMINTADHSADQKTFNIAGRAEYDFTSIIPGLVADVFYSRETVNTIDDIFASTNNKIVGGASLNALGRGFARRAIFDEESELVENTLNYVNNFNNLSVDFLSGYSWQQFIDVGFNAHGGDFIVDAVGVNNLSFAQDFGQGQGEISTFKEQSNLVAGFGRLSMNWDDTYFLNGSVRREGSSKFGENNKFGTFWSIGSSIEFTNIFEIPKMSRLKIRASYGITGQDAPSVGLSKVRFAPTGNFLFDGRFSQSFSPISNDNPDLKWEEKTEFNIGLDLGLLDDKITATVEYYDQKTDDLIFPIEVPVPPNLFPTTFKNIGTLENKGLEFSINANVVNTPNFSWNTALNNTIFGNTVLTNFLGEDVRIIANSGGPGVETDMVRIVEGEQIGNFFGPKFSRFATEADAENFDVSPGSSLCVAPNGNEFDCRQITNERLQVLGNGLPEWQAGWTNDITYKNFDFSLFIRGVFGHEMINGARMFFESPRSLGNANILKAATRIENFNDGALFSSRNIEDASFIRFENLTLGYTIPLSTTFIRNFRVYFSANNLATITDWKGVDPTPRFVDPGPVSGNFTNFDPDPSGTTEGGGVLAPGIARRNNWFTTRSFTLGVNIDF